MFPPLALCASIIARFVARSAAAFLALLMGDGIVLGVVDGIVLGVLQLLLDREKNEGERV